jgi:hypothetical protein
LSVWALPALLFLFLFIWRGPCQSAFPVFRPLARGPGCITLFLLKSSNGTIIVPMNNHLHPIAHKCRGPQLGRQALHILFTTQKQKGLEYSRTLGIYAQAAAGIEEHRANAEATQRRESRSLVRRIIRTDLRQQPREKTRSSWHKPFHSNLERMKISESQTLEQ